MSNITATYIVLALASIDLAKDTDGEIVDASREVEGFIFGAPIEEEENLFNPDEHNILSVVYTKNRGIHSWWFF